MKKLFIYLGITTCCIILFISCATTSFPSQNIVVTGTTPCGKVYLRLRKGDLDKDKYGQFWLTEEEFLRLRDEAPELEENI